jgi:uncharacterized protein (DUF305 family)
MKTTILVAGAAIALASAAAYAQMQYPRPGDATSEQHNQPSTMQHDPMTGHGRMMHHGHMMGQGRMAQHQMGPGHMMGPGRMQASPSGTHDSHAAKAKGDTGPSSLAFQGINKKMHDGMDITFTGNADVDFVRGMIPHHQGAVDMAKTVIAFGKDPAVRKLAEEIIKAQESEIALMQDWLKKNAP